MYRLKKFGTTDLPEHMPMSDMATAPVVDAYVTITGGQVYDGYGSGTADIQLPYTIRYDGIYKGTSLANLRTQVDALRALRGQRLRLYRQALDDTSYHWCWARLDYIDINTTPTEHYAVIQPMSLTFVVQSMWYGAAHGGTWTLDSGEYLDTGLYLDESEEYTLTSSPGTCTINNAGNVNQPNAIITITANGGSAIDSVNVAISGTVDWTYGGSVAAGNALTINCGGYSVKNNGTADYDNFSLGSAHALARWFQIAPGDNDVVVTYTGGGTAVTVLFEYSDGWA